MIFSFGVKTLYFMKYFCIGLKKVSNNKILLILNFTPFFCKKSQVNSLQEIHFAVQDLFFKYSQVTNFVKGINLFLKCLQHPTVQEVPLLHAHLSSLKSHKFLSKNCLSKNSHTSSYI